MRQTFPFTHPRHKPPQALAALKHRIRKYLKRERRKALPEGVDYWDFDCRIGPDESAAKGVHVAELIKQLDALAADGCSHAYVEILAKPGYRASQDHTSQGHTSQGRTSQDRASQGRASQGRTTTGRRRR